jgi:hypothetical protein
MMNPKIIIVAFLIVTNTVCGQVNFPLNASGKIEISEVVIDSLPKEELYSQADKMFASLSNTPELKLKALKKDSVQGNMIASLEFPVYYQSGVIRKMQGLVSYQLELSVKDNKYRYVYTDFVFHAYAQDRYHFNVPTGKVKPLEETEAFGWQKDWDRCRNSTKVKVDDQVATIKTKMIPVVAPPVTVSKKYDW